MNKLFKIILIITVITAFMVMFISCKNGETAVEKKQAVEEQEKEEAESNLPEPDVKEDDKGNRVTGMISDTVPGEAGHIMIGNVGDFNFEPSSIKTVRDDIFNEGYFSVFDILVYLDDEDLIDMDYHFDEDMNTHVIDSINGMGNWWYIAYYDGGWPERNVFRMDHYPYKDRMYISVSEAEESQLEEYYRIFREEVERKNNNGGKIIVPEVLIRTPGDGSLIFENVEVKPHDLRNDIFKPGTITAIDAIMSLGDEGKIKYVINWHESVGTAGVVKDYFVDTINEDTSVNRCGFVYEEGSLRFQGFVGNHIHIPSDSRVINSPEYIEFFWICI